MKKILIFFLLAIPCLANSQSLDPTTNKITYTEVIQVPGTQDQLFDKALLFFNSAFKSAKDVIQIQDKGAGKIIGKFNIPQPNSRMGHSTATISVFVKEGKYKYIISDIYYSGTSEFPKWNFEDHPSAFKSMMTKGAQEKIRDDTSRGIVGVIENLKKQMTAKAQDDF